MPKPRPKRRYRVRRGDVVDETGAIVYDHIDDPQEARDIARLMNEGHDGDWESLRPELEKLRRRRKP